MLKERRKLYWHMRKLVLNVRRFGGGRKGEGEGGSDVVFKVRK